MAREEGREGGKWGGRKEKGGGRGRDEETEGKREGG